MTGVNIVASYGDDFFHISRNASVQVSCIWAGVCTVMWPDLYLFYEQNANSGAFWLYGGHVAGALLPTAGEGSIKQEEWAGGKQAVSEGMFLQAQFSFQDYGLGNCNLRQIVVFDVEFRHSSLWLLIHYRFITSQKVM